MKNPLTMILSAVLVLASPPLEARISRDMSFVSSEEPLLSVEDMRHDFRQLRQILEAEHCGLYEYTGREEFDRLFDSRLALIAKPMRYEEFFRIMAPITAKVGCMHTALWMPGKFFNSAAPPMLPP